MADHVANRDAVIRSLMGEIIGPAPAGKELDCSQPIEFTTKEESYGPWRESGSGEEILQRDPPSKRYGVGVLYPYAAQEEEPELDEAGVDARGFIAASSEEEVGTEADDPSTELLHESLERTGTLLGDERSDWGPGDLDLSLANAYRPSSIGISFLAEIPEGSKLVVEASGGRYRSLPVKVPDGSLTWWVRSPVSLRAEFGADEIRAPSQSRVSPFGSSGTNVEGLDVQVETYSRPFGENNDHRIITVVLVNRSESGTPRDEYCLFQVDFGVTILSENGNGHILPYPGPALQHLEEEERSLQLLYRQHATFAVGHGCAAGWDRADEGKAREVRAECIPLHERPSITPEITDMEGNLIEVPMAPLAGLVDGEDNLGILEEVVREYEDWISQKKVESEKLSAKHQDTARRHIGQCERCALRMKRGIQYLREDPKAERAFRLANHAILLQQAHPRRDPRRASYDPEGKRIVFDEEFTRPDPLNPGLGKGSWYAFQIAFLLMTVETIGEKDSAGRDTVELIWFPTGGGKTEAYLGLAAFAQFMRRLKDPDDDGTHVIMRYTLRLLTTQQFQRASRLVCAMEYLRREFQDELGTKPFSIGMWVGRANSPNTRQEAVRIFKSLSRGDRFVQNTFVLDRCPWCSAQMGPLKYKGRPPIHAPRVLGYVRKGTTVIFQCRDRECDFSGGIPVYVIDEDIYDVRPSMIIGTVDKFAMLAWRPEARAIFGLNEGGNRFCSPPNLIIQDELHLISGPLGSMVGLYEAVIEELCTDRRGGGQVRPKIISSTATIRRYSEQIRGLYAREDVVLFPPPGLDAGDSFFAKYAKDEDGALLPGTAHVGVHAPGLGSMQTVQVRTFTALLQAPMLLSEEERDPWWTLLLFFNSLRELGTTLSLLQSDIPDYQRALLFRQDPETRERRGFWEIMELTGRAASEEVPKAIAALERSYPNEEVRPIDVCLASSILEVGVDIDRLSLMSIVGQPKTTSQYIQVTGRIGRKWKERPGLVVTIYSASKPRDRSHYEKFRSYHERLYAQVEPSSVTPFSPPALDRALHAVMVSYVRQAGAAGDVKSPYPYPEGLIEDLKKILLQRVKAVDPAEVENFERVFEKRAREWKLWQRTRWRAGWSEDDPGLLRGASDYAGPESALVSWATPQSMRTVDAECIAEIPVPVGEGPQDAKQA